MRGDDEQRTGGAEDGGGDGDLGEDGVGGVGVAEEEEQPMGSIGDKPAKFYVAHTATMMVDS